MEGLGLDVDDFFKKVLEDIKKMHEIGLVHADLSEYNIIVSRKGPVIIDLSQTVSLKHPKAREFLERDMFNFRKVCKKWGVDLDRSIEKLIGKVETEL
jgi:RIO kinase 1